MEFEWDEDKRRRIRETRDVDIVDAASIFERPETIVEWEDKRREYGERRFIAVGISERTAYQIIYTWRGSIMRLITAWKITEEDYEKYKARDARRNKEDEGERRG